MVNSGRSLEEEAQDILLELLVGTRPPVPERIRPVLVSLACSESPPRSPKSGQAYAQVALGSSLVDRVAALLTLDELDEVDLFDTLEALRAESEELPPLWVMRQLFAHPACTDRVKLRLALKYVKRSTPKIYPTAWKMLIEHSGAQARAGAQISALVTSANTGLIERLARELAELGDPGFELFTTLIKDRSQDPASTGALGLSELAEIITTSKNLSDD